MAVERGYLLRGVVHEVVGSAVRVVVRDLAPGRALGPFTTCVPDLEPGDVVMMGRVGTAGNDLVVMGRVLP